MFDIRLVRTEGKAFSPGATLSPERFVALPDLQRASKTTTTRQVESDYGLGDCLYFYAGHACPDFGDVVLVYRAAMADDDAGNATPFDTGGLHGGYISVDGVVDRAGRKDYCARHMRTLSTWRNDASTYVAAHFSSGFDYVLGAKPTTDDATGRLLNARNSRRAWTWEVRLHRDHPISQELIRVWMTADYYQAVRNELLLNTGAHGRCRALIKGDVIKAVSLGKQPHVEAEREVASCL